jgi:hypothetical protein
VLFHPNSGNVEEGEIGAIRLGSYKVVYYTGKFQCKYVNGMTPLEERSFNIKPVTWGLQVLNLYPLNQSPSISGKCVVIKNTSCSHVHFSTF